MGAALVAVVTQRSELFSYEAVAIAWFKHPELVTKNVPLEKLQEQLLAVVHVKNTTARNAVRAASNRAVEKMVHRGLLKPSNRHSIEVLLDHPVKIKELPFDHREATKHYLVKLAKKILKERTKKEKET